MTKVTKLVHDTMEEMEKRLEDFKMISIKK